MLSIFLTGCNAVSLTLHPYVSLHGQPDRLSGPKIRLHILSGSEAACLGQPVW